MSNYILYTDSTTDLSPELIKQLDVKIIPFEFIIGSDTYKNYPDGRELSSKEFYKRLRAGEMATTSLVNTERYIEIFEPDLKAGFDIVYIAFSSNLSGSAGCAFQAAEDLRARYPERKLHVLDSLCASMGQGLLVYEAAQQKKAGLSPDDLAAWVEQNRNSICQWFTVDDLGFLRRGGRVSGAAAILGSMLGIKPVLHVDIEGRLMPVQKVRGRRNALEALLDHMKKTLKTIKDGVVMISHGDCEEDCRWVESQVRSRFGIKEIYTNYIGPVIGAHSGPGTVALFFVGNER